MKRNIRIFKKSLEYFRPFKWPIFVLVILSLLINTILNSSSYILGRLVDALTSPGQEFAMGFAITYVFFLAVPLMLRRFSGWFEVKRINFDLFNHLQKQSLFKSLYLSLGQLRREHSGFKQDILRSGESGLDYFYNLVKEEILPAISSFSVAIIGLYFVGIEFFLTSLIFAFVYYAYGMYVNSVVREPLRVQIEKSAQRNKVYIDILRSLFFIKFANQKKTALTYLERAQNDFRNFGVKTWGNFNARMIISDLMQVTYYATFVYLVYRSLQTESLTVGMLIPIFAWMTMFSGSLSRIRNMQRRIGISISNVEKMFEMLEQKTDLEEFQNPIPVTSFEDKISFEGVFFDYEDGKKDALKDLHFQIKKGEKVALVGRSGSGKTTIVSLLLRLYDPTRGSILVDGVELKMLELSQWHDLIAYVPQDGDLLDISIRDNILFGAKRAVTDADIEDVLLKAGIKEFIHNLPQGIDTLVGEKGVKLSGGQKQRVCIARALIKDAPILLLDEATSSLDSETESLVNKAIWNMLGDKTGVVIAHRLSTILDADKIIVMDHGEIVGVGTHTQLLKTTPYYKTLVDAQNVNL